MTDHAPLPSRRGFSLVELSLSTAIMSVLLLSLGSAIVLGSRAVPSGEESIDDELAIARAASHLRQDLALATEIRFESGGGSADPGGAQLKRLGIQTGVGGPPDGTPGQGGKPSGGAPGGGGDADVTIEAVVPDITGDGAADTVVHTYDAGSSVLSRVVSGVDGAEHAYGVSLVALEFIGPDDDPSGVVVGLGAPGSDRRLRLRVMFRNDPTVRVP